MLHRNYYLIYPAIRRGFSPSRMTSNNLINQRKVCYNSSFALPKQPQRSRFVLQHGSRDPSYKTDLDFVIFRSKKKLRLIIGEIQ